MKSIQLISLFAIFFFTPSCFVIKDSQGVGVGNTVVTYGTYTVNSPNINLNYSYTDINNNIEKIDKLKEMLKNDLNSINKEKEKITSSDSLTQQQKNIQLQQLSTKREKINMELPKMDKLFNEWENIGFKNPEYRAKKEEKEGSLANIKIENFDSFIGIKNFDPASSAIKLFGNTDFQSTTLLEYYVGKKTVLSFGIDYASGKITSIKIFGKEGYDFVKSKTEDKKINLIGLRRTKIQEYFGIASYSFDYQLDYNYKSYMEISFFLDKIDLSCNSIEVYWKNKID